MQAVQQFQQSQKPRWSIRCMTWAFFRGSNSEILKFGDHTRQRAAQAPRHRQGARPYPVWCVLWGSLYTVSVRAQRASGRFALLRVVHFWIMPRRGGDPKAQMQLPPCSRRDWYRNIRRGAL